jgi:HTH-type transcriptional regulator/antitoxin HigA
MPAAKVKKNARAVDGDLPKADERFLELVRECPLYPIRSEAELDRAIAMIDRLIDKRGLTQGEEDYQTVLAGLVYNYESFHEPIPDVSPAEMLEHLIDVRGVTQGAVAAAVGVSDAAISQILSGKRLPGRKLMAALADYFKVDPSVFL